MIIVRLDTPIRDGEAVIDELRIETPIRVGHLLKAMRTTSNGSLLSELFTASVLGVSQDVLEQLTIEDYARVQEVLSPFLASFLRCAPQSGDVK